MNDQPMDLQEAAALFGWCDFRSHKRSGTVGFPPGGGYARRCSIPRFSEDAKATIRALTDLNIPWSLCSRFDMFLATVGNCRALSLWPGDALCRARKRDLHHKSISTSKDYKNITCKKCLRILKLDDECPKEKP